MKFLIVILAVVALAHAEEAEWKVKTNAELNALRKECIEEFPLSDELTSKIRNFEYPDEENVRKYLLCTAKKIGFFCEQEGYHASRLHDQFNKDMDKAEFLAIVEGCSDKNEQKSPADVWMFRVHTCIMASKAGEFAKAYLKKQYEELKKSS